MNLNSLAKEICLREGKKKQTDIAQVKEVLKVTLEILKDQTFLVEQDLGRYIVKLCEHTEMIGRIYARQDFRIPILDGKKGNVVAKKKPKVKAKKK